MHRVAMLDLIDLPGVLRFAYVIFTMRLTPVKLYFATSVDTGYMCELHYPCKLHFISKTLLNTIFCFKFKICFFAMTKIFLDQN